MSESSPFQSPESADLNKARRRKAPQDLNADRLPPFALEAEQGVLGCCFIDPATCIDQCIEKIGERPEAFYDLRHQTIYTVIVEMFDAQEGIDIITVQQRLKDRQLLEQVGGIPYLNELTGVVPSAGNLSYYLEDVFDKWQLRRLISTCSESVVKAYQNEGEVETLVDEVERDVLAIRGNVSTDGFKAIREYVPDSMVEIEGYLNREGVILGLATGFNDFDRMTGGLNGGEMVVIAARPSMGKTSFAMNIAENIAVRNRIPVGVFSLEMTAKALTTRMISTVARVSLRNAQAGFGRSSDSERYGTAALRVNAAPLFIDDTPGLSIMQVRARARKLARTQSIKLFVIDYLQLMNSTSRRAQDNRQQEVSEISSGIKALAKELNVPVIVLSQLNRELEKDKTRKPRLSDLRESGSIEQDADLVGFLYKVKNDEGEDPEDSPDGIPVNLLIAKQRNGPTGDVNLIFMKPITRFESASRVGNEDVPAPPSSQPEFNPQDPE